MTERKRTHDELLELLEDGSEVPVPYFGDQTLTMQNFGDIDTAELVPALQNFLALRPEQRIRDGRHLVAYCRMMVDAVGEEVLEDLDNRLPDVDRIWDYATPHSISFKALDAGPYAARRTVFVAVEGEVAWEREHGLQMCWADGDKLVRVSEYDGHPTNGHASAKPEQDAYVFACYEPDLCTTPDS